MSSPLARLWIPSVILLAVACGSSDDAPPAAPGGGGPDAAAVDPGSSGSVDGSDPDAGTQASASVVLNEIMYHPVMENAPDDNHEFVEVFNKEAREVDLSGWKLSGEVKFTFPAGTKIAAKGYRVVAKNKSALVALAPYKLVADDVLGDYPGSLSNNGGTLNLEDAGGRISDSMTYSPAFPWPAGADALGADDRWLSRLPTPLTQAPHQYLGRSLERVSADVPSLDASNWIPSPLDGATPGRQNSFTGAPPTIVTKKTVTPSGAGPLVRAVDTVKIGVVFSTLGKLANPKLQYFVDDVQATGEPITTVDMQLAAGVWEAQLPAQASNAIVRYRIQADIGAGAETVSPRASDPYAWWAYFVTPDVATTAPIYHMFIKKADWTQLWTNINFIKDDKRVAPGCNNAAVNSCPTMRCAIRESWDADVPAVFIYKGEVFDVFARYQGSHANRQNGLALDKTKTTINPYPDQPAAGVYSWDMTFPAYATFEPIYAGGPSRDHVVLNKLNSSCPGLNDAVGERIYSDPAVHVPVQKTRYVRFHVNGGYYHYMMDVEHVDSDMMKRYLAPNEKMGDLFKADGNGGPQTNPMGLNNLEGPYSFADESPLTLNPSCPMITLDDRYTWTFGRVTNKWQNNTIVKTLAEAMDPIRNAAKASGDYTALRTFLKANFDYEEVLNYVAVRNWAGAFDDTHHNHFIYKRATDGRWLMIVQDKDGEFSKGNFSFFEGEEGDPTNRPNADGTGEWHHVKDAFIKAFRTEYIARIVALDAGPLAPAAVQADVDAAAATFSKPDAAASPAFAASCNFDSRVTSFKSWAACRHQWVLKLNGGPTPTCN